MNGVEARKMLAVQEPIEVAWTSKDGTQRADDGDEIDPRQTVPWVMALGPFGSWPETLEGAEESLALHNSWVHGPSFRLGFAVTWEQGWGYQAKETAV